MKVNEIFTVEKYVCGSTGTDFYLCHLEGGILLLDVAITPCAGFAVGGKQKKIFTFQCVQAGHAAIQFAYTQASTAPYVYIYEEVQPFEIEDITPSLEGGWTGFRPLDEEDQAIFDKAIEGLTGAQYKPTEVATQVVAGTNFCFHCEVTRMCQEPVKEQATVFIFRPLPYTGQDPFVTKIIAGEEKP